MPAIHVFAPQASRGWPRLKGVYARLRRAMRGHDGLRHEGSINTKSGIIYQPSLLSTLAPRHGRRMPAIHAPLNRLADQDVDARDKRGHDESNFARLLLS